MMSPEPAAQPSSCSTRRLPRSVGEGVRKIHQESASAPPNSGLIKSSAFRWVNHPTNNQQHGSALVHDRAYQAATRELAMTTISIVTGGSRGLGRNTATSIARRGGDVIFTYRKGAEAPRPWSRRSRRSAGRRQRCSSTSATSRVAGLRRRGPRDAAVLGPGQLRSSDQQRRSRRDGELRRDHRGAVRPAVRRPRQGRFFLTQALLPLMADGGRIVNFSSGLTRVSYPGFSAYSAAKGAIEILTLYMAKELGSRGITAKSSRPARSKPISSAARCAIRPIQRGVRQHDRARPRRHAR